ncbi:myosin heavy chain, clone 203 [Eurosta solidaginis]|uniref:myosin heavy chain, clone 203 n=1 Tax=Eurosta solidaginis TaxID=178769 RepID=UPI0035312474
MFTGTLDFNSNRIEETELPGENYQSSRCTSHSTFSITKCFPNDFSSLSGRLEYVPSNNPMLVERNSQPILECAKTTTKHNRYYPYAADAEVRLASMRIFALIMLNAWRRRREDVKRLLLKVEDLKKGSQKAKNQIHVYNTLFRVEQKRNDELACQLKSSLENVIQAKSSCESLTTSVMSLKAERALLEQDLANKHKEMEALADILSQTKNDLFLSMVQQRNLRSALSKEQRSVQVLENQKSKLINELYQLTNESREIEDKYRTELVRKEVDLERSIKRVKLLEDELNELNDKSNRLDEYTVNDTRLRNEIKNLQTMVVELQQTLDTTFGRRLSHCWQKICRYQQKGFFVVQMFLYCLLPAIPIPAYFPKFKGKHNLMIGPAGFYNTS